MSYSIETIVNGQWKQNCYVLSDNSVNSAIIIDPGGDFIKIKSYLADKKLNPLAIFNTHGHFDHIGAVDSLMELYSIPFFLSKDDRALVKQANTYRFLFDTKEPITIPVVTNSLDDEFSIFNIGPFQISILKTPGHTEGSVCLLFKEEIFTGDTIFSKSLGRVDLPGGDAKALSNSVDKLRELPEGLRAWPGHGRPFYLKKLWANLDKDCGT